MQSYEQYINALNDFIHTWLYAYKNVQLAYVCFDGEVIDEGYTSPDVEFMYILWADGSQSRMYISESSEREILVDFLTGRYKKVPKDEYI